MSLVAASATLTLTNARLCSSNSLPVFHPSIHPRFRTLRFNPRIWDPQRRPPLTTVVSASLTTQADVGEDELAHSSSASSPTVAEAVAGIRKIPFSDVVVMRERRIFWGRKWNYADIFVALTVLSLHGLCLFAPFTFTWPAFWTFFWLYVATALFGVNVCLHRYLSHASFKLPKWLEYTFAYFGTHSLQGDPMDWVSRHRHHHQHCDKEGDPHSPTEGFWFSHFTWIFDNDLANRRNAGPSIVSDLEEQYFYRFMRDTYLLHPIALGALLYAIGGFPFVVWGVGLRISAALHAIWIVNSVCHVWGHRAWNTNDLSKNNWFVGLLAFGEGWHNNHHAFQFSARHGLEWWQVDVSWYVIRLLEMLGLATEVKLPTQAQMERMKLKKGS